MTAKIETITERNNIHRCFHDTIYRSDAEALTTAVQNWIAKDSLTYPAGTKVVYTIRLYRLGRKTYEWTYRPTIL